MGFFDIFKKKTEHQQPPALDAVIARNRVKCSFTVEQQREWLAVLNKTIPTVMLGESPICVDYCLTPRMLAEAGSMLNTVGQVAFQVAKALFVTNMEKALRNRSVTDLVRSYCILEEYAKMLKEPYGQAINDAMAYIYTVLSKADLSSCAAAKQENLLYWAPAIYADDPLTLLSPDREIHVFADAGKLLTAGAKLQTDRPLPHGYTFAQKSSGKILHLRMIQNPMLKQEMIPLFTDPNLLLQIFTPNTRISVVDFETARRLCLQDRNRCSGIVINPGRDNQVIPISQLEQA